MINDDLQTIINHLHDTTPGDRTEQIAAAGLHLTVTLLTKNAAYGDAALTGQPILASGSTLDRIHNRIDDKLHRYRNQHPDDTEDTTLDLAGYFLLLHLHHKERTP